MTSHSSSRFAAALFLLAVAPVPAIPAQASAGGDCSSASSQRDEIPSSALGRTALPCRMATPPVRVAARRTRSAATPTSRGPTESAVRNSKYVARQVFRTPCRRVHVAVRRQTSNPRFVGEAVAPCGVVIRRGDYTFIRICALIVHEYGHLAGFDHSTDPNNIMHPARPPRYPPCVRHAALMGRKAARANRA